MIKMLNTFVLMLAYSSLSSNNDANIEANCEIYNDLKKSLNV